MLFSRAAASLSSLIALAVVGVVDQVVREASAVAHLAGDRGQTRGRVAQAGHGVAAGLAEHDLVRHAIAVLDLGQRAIGALERAVEAIHRGVRAGQDALDLLGVLGIVERAMRQALAALDLFEDRRRRVHDAREVLARLLGRELLDRLVGGLA